MKKKRYYKEGFFTFIKTSKFPYGINNKIINKISKKQNEPKWILDFRLNAYNCWKKMKEPHWLKGYYKKIKYNNISYYISPLVNHNNKKKNIKTKKLKNKNKYFKNYLTNEIKYTFDKLGVPIEDKNSKFAVDAIFDSVSVYTTYTNKLKDNGIIFCSFSKAIQEHPLLVKKYLGTVVPYYDNFFSALNSSVYSDGTFVYIPKNTKCPIELSTYFRINSEKTGQFERTIIIADENSYVSYIEGCTAPNRNKNQLHAAVVEVILFKNSEVKYSTVQNWFAGNKPNTGILNFVTKRAICKGKNSKMSWIQSETGSSITWKYPSVILHGNNSSGNFYSVSITNGYQQSDTGTKMIHIGKNTTSTIISKGIAYGKSSNTYRGLVKIMSKAINSKNYTQCDSMIIGNKCGVYTFPSIESHNNSSIVEHEATTSSIGDDQLFYCNQRGINIDNAISIIANGFCKEIFSELPLEFSIEAKKILSIILKKSVG
ncbi:MAG: Fe-S cluster assembly protein SufB [Candidatus Makana argininalis]